ncbi:hypothetical protein HYW42_04285 [Candidatus Daviesbacteria bacterium]|nr:hypothetical protein [Candidatus Daviesbacteria bacterium]
MLNFLKLFIFILIVIFSYFLIQSTDTSLLSDRSLFLKSLVALVSGVFYTSFLTSPLAVVILVVLGQTTNIFSVTLLAGIGAVAGDMLIVKSFRFIFRQLSFVSHSNSFNNLKKQFIKYHLDILSLIIGIVIVASPFPDELGLIMLGASKLSYFKLAILTFVVNSVGILIILTIVKGIS